MLVQYVAATGVRLSAAQMAAVEAVFTPHAAQGARYPEAGWAGMETTA